LSFFRRVARWRWHLFWNLIDKISSFEALRQLLIYRAVWINLLLWNVDTLLLFLKLLVIETWRLLVIFLILSIRQQTFRRFIHLHSWFLFVWCNYTLKINRILKICLNFSIYFFCCFIQNRKRFAISFQYVWLHLQLWKTLYDASSPKTWLSLLKLYLFLVYLIETGIYFLQNYIRVLNQICFLAKKLFILVLKGIFLE